ncbi:MAG: FkbM family methyltransferase [Hoeflea sp.]|uniref:FkbM family methyltransferase n=1 Tax=Hoeflea sp. TaxID=1940281 RepID=UPI00329753DE
MTIRSEARRVVRRLKYALQGKRPPKPDAFLDDCRGVIHVGASSGQEAPQYAERGLNVLWYEPIPLVFQELLQTIEPYSNQTAIEALLTDQPNASYKFNIAGNQGCSSSIFEMKEHKKMWPDVGYVSSIELQSSTLVNSLTENAVDTSLYDALILDTQGSELLVLKGAEMVLDRFRYIKTEAADFEAYEGCARASEIVAWLAERGFKKIDERVLMNNESIGKYYDLVFRKESTFNQ